MCDEILTDEELADKLRVTPRWVKDQARKRESDDPLPARKLGRVRTYDWDCPESTLWQRIKAWLARRERYGTK